MTDELKNVTSGPVQPVDGGAPEAAPSEEAEVDSSVESPEVSRVESDEQVADTQDSGGSPEAGLRLEEESRGGESPSDEVSDDVPDEVSDEVPDEDDDVDDDEPVDSSGALELDEDVEDVPDRDWYILKVQSNREDSIRDTLVRRIKIAGLESYFGEIIVPVEMVTEFKAGKKRVVKRKLYPGYIVAHMSITDDTWFLVRETPGIGDFTGAAGKPSPMLPHEVERILPRDDEEDKDTPTLNIGFNLGDRVKINVGTFENFEGDVDVIDNASGRVTVMINIFGRSTPVELEYWQLESV